jgi:hypothetical protein
MGMISVNCLDLKQWQDVLLGPLLITVAKTRTTAMTMTLRIRP